MTNTLWLLLVLVGYIFFQWSYIKQLENQLEFTIQNWAEDILRQGFDKAKLRIEKLQDLALATKLFDKNTFSMPQKQNAEICKKVTDYITKQIRIVENENTELK
mgnify:CR=1 FL=1